jgi:ABC-type antimicrobial peptide transport system permease subunit
MTPTLGADNETVKDIGAMNQAFRVAWFRHRALFRQRLVGLLTITVLVGSIGGLALASVAGARRTESSFPAYLASTNPSTLGVFTRYDDPGLKIDTGYDPQIVMKIAHLPDVMRATSAIIFDGNINLSGVKGIHPHSLAGETPPTVIGSPDGEFTDVDRVSLVAGRRANPNRLNEAVLNVQAANELGIHIGSVIQIPMYTDAQALLSNPGKPFLDVKVKMVGEITLADNIVESDFDSLGSATIIFSPALTRLLAPKCATGTETWLQLRGGDGASKRVLSEIYRLDPTATNFGGGELTSHYVPAVQQAIEPEAIALAVFGGIAGLAAVLIVSLMMGRMLRVESEETRTLRALGASRRMLRTEQLAGVLGAVFVGGILAEVLAVGLSPLSPLGPVRPVYPHPGISFDWTVLGFGFLILVGLLFIAALFFANRELRRITSASESRAPKHESRLVRSVANSGLPISAVSGVRFALESGEGGNATPVRSAILGTILAVTVLVTTLTFGASLDGLVSRPALYGWNWNYTILSSFAGAEDMPAHQTAAFLDADHDIASWSAANVVSAELNGHTVGMLAEQPATRVAPPILSGHGLEKSNEIVLGAATLTTLHKHVGETVTFTDGASKAETLRIVGTATMPAVEDGLGMGSGAIVATSDFPTSLLNLQDAPIPGPNVIFIRTRGGIEPAAAYRSLEKVNSEIDAVPASSGLAGGVVRVLRPVEIVNFHSMGTTPTIFSALLTIGAIAALGITLGASVRRRRRDLALLKSLGFRQRQLSSAIAWQATVAAVFGVVFGIPLGIAIGRQLWILFARGIDAVPDPSIPAVSIALVALGTVIFANLVATIPGRIAARTSTALVLRSE